MNAPNSQNISKKNEPFSNGVETPRIGCIGQGWIGRNYADDFERRGYTVVRYSLEEPYVKNKEAIAECDVVFIAVPTPTSSKGFDASTVRDVLPLVGKGKIAVIKSTIIPGTTNLFHSEFPNIYVVHSPEFLREKTAAEDAQHPERNIVGIPETSDEYEAVAQLLLSVLPRAPYTRVMSATSAELVKYAGNAFLMMKVVFANLLYDLSESLSISYDEVSEALGADPRIGASHLQPISASGHSVTPGRGAAGHCFIKDFEALRQLQKHLGNDPEGEQLLASIVKKNNALLTASGKDIDLLRSVYGTSHELLP